jgi:hypothetical protein
MPSRPNENRLLTLMALGEIEVSNEVRFNDVGELLDGLHRRRMEDQYDLKLADRSMREMRRGGVKAIPIDVMIESIDRKIS